MGVLGAHLLKQLQGADSFGRLRAYYPVVPDLDHRSINVHAKVLVVDDALVRIGSSNLANRSMELDTECDLAIEATGKTRIARHRPLSRSPPRRTPRSVAGDGGGDSGRSMPSACSSTTFPKMNVDSDGAD
jgi:phosphatidylserine/phosphatidylglycerophosphate/cardiolipin synthase-like enzyme